jgi:hypothetical protein
LPTYVTFTLALCWLLTQAVKDMGLGKTLSMLALICSSLDYDKTDFPGEQNSKYRGTLIVAPMSSELTIEHRKTSSLLTMTEALYGWETQISE